MYIRVTACSNKQNTLLPTRLAGASAVSRDTHMSVRPTLQPHRASSTLPLEQVESNLPLATTLAMQSFNYFSPQQARSTHRIFVDYTWQLVDADNGGLGNVTDYGSSMVQWIRNRRPRYKGGPILETERPSPSYIVDVRQDQNIKSPCSNR